MSAFDPELASKRWDQEYRRGRYHDEPPLSFVETILTTLQSRPAHWNGRGLYVGCGNGRNFLPLVDAGLNLWGLDLSAESLRQLSLQRPSLTDQLIRGDIRDFRADKPFDYVIAIQVFQHGAAADVATYFSQVHTLLRHGGLFFLRVNAATTQIYHRHTVLERNQFGGYTIRYDTGPKQELPVHFYSGDELSQLTQNGFEQVMPLREIRIERDQPQTGFWSQWEGIWQTQPVR